MKYSLILASLLLIGTHALVVSATNHPLLDYRLPRNVRPTKYVLNMRMVLDENQDGLQPFTAPGNVTITVNCTEVTNSITLNAQYIQVQESLVKVTSSSGEIPIAAHSFQPDLHFYTIQLNETLEAGRNYYLFIPFTSQILTNDTYGLYRGYYTDGNTNLTKNMATTFFQPFGARRAFPCFDEPEYKAVFELTIGRVTKYHTLANMDLIKTVPDSQLAGWEWDQFRPTLPMSTYIVCVIVSDFASEAADPVYFPKPVKVWGTPQAIEKKGGVFAAEMASKLLYWHENFTGISYSLTKLDSIAIPQFAAGAMENWGLNTYRDAYLIYYPGDSDSAYIGVAETLSHELSHQWYGNLATCEWWDQTWLNEGLATFFTYKALLVYMSEFDPEMRFITRHHQSALRFDSNETKSHPVVIPTDSGFDFFDGTSMEKSGCLTRMMEYIFTKPVFKLALRYYILQNYFKSANQDSLFLAMDVTIDQFSVRDTVLPPNTTVKAIMDTWTLQTGYPLIRVRLENNQLIFSQENIIASQPDHTWWVPIKVVTQENPDFRTLTASFWIPPNSRNASYPTNSTGWVVINPEAVGFYRVLYDPVMTERIDQELARNSNAFTPITRAQIVDDRMNLGVLGYTSLLEAVKILNYIFNETNSGVLTSVVKNLKNVWSQVKDTEDVDKFKGVSIPFLENVIKNIGDENDFDKMGMTNILRNDVIKMLCDYGSPMCDSISNKYFLRLKSTTPDLYDSVVSRNIQDSIYCGIAKTGGANAKSFFKAWYKTETDSSKSKMLYRVLNGC
ncbi:unnamed protein product [Allacma fusca]|uniref:Aminopeptidase n=1 Tax=Allacma fusca TaxID=39272 RepID=A0A8J2LHB8_9HEXA|nr:unnamed protein product [Allacma fusca]